MSYFSAIRFEDSGSLDAFSRLRISSPKLIYDCQFTYDLQPLLVEQITAESGATISHDTTNRMALLSFSSTPINGVARMQTYEHFRYQPGRSQLVFITFNFLGGAANVLKFAGYSDYASNGIELQLTNTTAQLVLKSDTGSGDQTVTQNSWNIDPMNGTGSSGITLDFTKTQILVIDFQALYVGRVRLGFDIDGVIYYVHQFMHANILAVPYIQTANLPITCGMVATGTATSTMNYICSSVMSEGGEGDLFGYGFSQEGTATAGSGSRTHLLSLRPKTLFNSITNRSKFILDSVDVMVTGANSIYWELCIGQAISGTTTYNDVNETYSAIEYNTLGTISGSPAIVLAAGYVAATANSKASASSVITSRTPITLDAAGAVRALGTLSLIVTGIGGTSACRANVNWREVR